MTHATHPLSQQQGADHHAAPQPQGPRNRPPPVRRHGQRQEAWLENSALAGLKPGCCRLRRHPAAAVLAAAAALADAAAGLPAGAAKTVQLQQLHQFALDLRQRAWRSRRAGKPKSPPQQLPPLPQLPQPCRCCSATLPWPCSSCCRERQRPGRPRGRAASRYLPARLTWR